MYNIHYLGMRFFINIFMGKIFLYTDISKNIDCTCGKEKLHWQNTQHMPGITAFVSYDSRLNLFA
jgi:hypothetical protein